MLRYLASVSLLLGLLAHEDAFAQMTGPDIPDSLSVQGILTDTSGVVVPDGSYNLQFKLYKGGSSVWDHLVAGIPVKDGLFSVVLGGGSPSLGSVAFNGPMELGITPKPGTTELTPRTPLTAVPYALAIRGLYAVPREEISPIRWGTSLVGGAENNSISATAIGATISGGGGFRNGEVMSNQVTGDWGTVGGGGDNTATEFAVVSGGRGNVATNFGATISGGQSNVANGVQSVVGGGTTNQATSNYATVPGGILNSAGGTASFAAGTNASADHDGTFVWSDQDGSGFSSTGPNQFLVDAAGGVGINTNTTPQELNLGDGNDDGDVIARFNETGSGTDVVIGIHGSGYGLISVQSNDHLVFRTNGTEKMRLTNNGLLGVGTNGPDAGLHVHRASSTSTPQVQISAPGGTASDYARLRMKTSSSYYWDIASGAVANDELNFFSSAGRGNVISLRSTGTPLVAYNGATLSSGGDWNNASSVTLKTDFQRLDTRAVLERLSSLPLLRWRYKVESEETQHYGPMAEDFREAFGLGQSEKTISTVDADGVALAAIQGLYELVKEQQAEIERLKKIVEGNR